MRWNGQPGKRAEWSRTAEKDDGCDDARAEADSTEIRRDGRINRYLTVLKKRSKTNAFTIKSATSGFTRRKSGLLL